MLTSDGVAWGNSGYLTLSFAPDGTPIQAEESSLFSVMGEVGTEAQWKGAILRAFDQWSSIVNGDVGVVADSGEAFGIEGATRGDTRFGDIRIGARPLGEQVFALSVPPKIVSGTWVGDLIFNSQASIQSTDELFRIALHEAGNIFGLADNDDPNSPLFSGVGIPTAVEPSPLDVEAIERVFGARVADMNERNDRNDSIDEATRVRYSEEDGFDGSTPLIVYGDLSDSFDRDYYRFDNLAQYDGAATFEVRSQAISMLQPRLSIRDNDGNIVDSDHTAVLGGDTISISIDNIQPDERYFIEVGSASDSFSIGGYSLVITFDDLLVTTAGEIDEVANGAYRFIDQDDIQEKFLPEPGHEIPLLNDDAHVNDTLETASDLETAPGFVDSTRYEILASFSDADDIDFYRIRSPENEAATTVTTIHFRAMDGTSTLSEAKLYDRNGTEIPGQIIVNHGGDVVVQFPGIESSANYFVELVPLSSEAKNYELSVYSVTVAVELSDLASGNVVVGDGPAVHNYVAEVDQMVHFVVDASSSAVTVELRDSNSRLRARLVSPGIARSAPAIFLEAGEYALEVVGDGPVGASSPYQVFGAVITDPLAIPPDDSVEEPIVECPDLPPELCAPGDADMDGDVDWDDFDILFIRWGVDGVTWSDGDFDGDHVVGLSDYVALGNNFGYGAPSIPGNRTQLDLPSASSSASPPPISPIYGDFDGDGDVDTADRTRSAQHWTGAFESPVANNAFQIGDVDGDGDVDSADVTHFTANWTSARR